MEAQPAMEAYLDSIGKPVCSYAHQYTRSPDVEKSRHGAGISGDEEEIEMRIIIKLVSTAGTGHFYTTTKNPKFKAPSWN